jgi:hypothetical protein
MSRGLFISAFLHVAIVLTFLVLFARAAPFEATPETSITVDIVPQGEAPGITKSGHAQTGAPSKSAEQGADHSGETAPEQQTAKNPAMPESEPAHAAAGAAPSPAGPAAPAAPQQPAAPEYAGAPFWMSMIPALENHELGNAAPAATGARLTAEEIAAFRAQVQKCWSGPPGAADHVNVVLRVVMSPAGALTAEPLLLSASASALGPKVLESAKRALAQCQPYAVLPADKYEQWKVLDLTFTPRGIAG